MASPPQVGSEGCDMNIWNDPLKTGFILLIGMLVILIFALPALA